MLAARFFCEFIGLWLVESGGFAMFCFLLGVELDVAESECATAMDGHRVRMIHFWERDFQHIWQVWVAYGFYLFIF